MRRLRADDPTFIAGGLRYPRSDSHGCSDGTDGDLDSPEVEATSEQAPALHNAPTPSPAIAARVSPRTLTLEGLGALQIGEAVPADSGWAERGAQISEDCRTISSPDYQGVYAITDGKAVQRITIGQGSDVELVEGIGVGSTEQEVDQWFAGFREQPHEYSEAPAKYLTAPNAASGDSALRFEIGTDGKTGLIHVGTMPVLGYVEGCA